MSKYAGTPWAILYEKPKPIELTPQQAKQKKKWQQELARREKKKTATQEVLRDNKQYANWTI